METSPLVLPGPFVLEPVASPDDHGRYSDDDGERDIAATGAASNCVEPDTGIAFRLTDDNNRDHAGSLPCNGAELGIARPCGDRPAWVFPADRQWPALAALESSFHHQET